MDQNQIELGQSKESIENILGNPIASEENQSSDSDVRKIWWNVDYQNVKITYREDSYGQREAISFIIESPRIQVYSGIEVGNKVDPLLEKLSNKNNVVIYEFGSPTNVYSLVFNESAYSVASASPVLTFYCTEDKRIHKIVVSDTSF